MIIAIKGKVLKIHPINIPSVKRPYKEKYVEVYASFIDDIGDIHGPYYVYYTFRGGEITTFKDFKPGDKFTITFNKSNSKEFLKLSDEVNSFYCYDTKPIENYFYPERTFSWVE